MNNYMELAILEGLEGIKKNHGGPFGSVVIKDGVVVGRGHNRVLSSHDPTCHGEIDAIRDATKNLNTHDLSGCVIYTTSEPCHMCLCACLWANIDKIYYGCTIKDNGIIGFRDDNFDKIFGGRDILKDRLECIDRDKCVELFNYYNELDRERY